MKNFRHVALGAAIIFGSVFAMRDAAASEERISADDAAVGDVPTTIDKMKSTKTLPYCKYNKVSQSVINECLSLADLYQATNGHKWKHSTGWLTSTHHCNWYGVNCSAVFSAAGTVKRLTLFENALRGSIPVSIGNLVNLRFLELNHNALTGSIPASIGNLINLKYLELSRNSLTGSIPASISDLANLDIGLYLDSNALTGSIPDEFCDLHYLSLRADCSICEHSSPACCTAAICGYEMSVMARMILVLMVLLVMMILNPLHARGKNRKRNETLEEEVGDVEVIPIVEIS